MLTSRQIIIKLINDKIINGEEAFTLINDIIQAEMVETYKVLENKNNSDLFKEINVTPYTSGPKITWTGDFNTSTSGSWDGYTTATNAKNSN